MKKLLIVSFAALMLAACGNEEKTSEPAKDTVKNVSNEVVNETTNEDEEVESKENNSLKESLSVDEFNARFKQDSEEKQYPNGKFQLKDGSIVNADKFNYEGNSMFDYATVIFFGGKIAHMQVDTESSIEDIEKGLGISFKDARVEEYKYGSGYEVIFNETFADENIAVLPNEWD
ncbi:hypothetical protein [Peribacillus sp. R9-11]|uniref:hypothetical protein n=1 Tax=Peribacillus sp. R9-11 TaxID=3073271 RepID=UPI002868EB13|nr:hypothetical protein [Peribacillus sp. R9-11]WMX58101.1 hypothetical protein RE409_13255 [Peribacillus sp. R9-11]